MNRLSIALGLAVAVLAGSCVEREMTITSQPAGALVYVSDVEKGRTPLTMPFLWYGDYDIVLRSKGYQTLKTHARVNPPIYEVPPLDLFSAIAPWTYRDQRYLHFDMDKLVEPTDEDLIRRADSLAERNREPVKR